MKNLYLSTEILDKRATEKYALSEEILMQNAATKIANHINKRFKKARVLCVCGGGNNGADVYAVARILSKKHKVKVVQASKNLKPLAKIEYERAIKSGVKITKKIGKTDVVVDGVFGSGLNRELDTKYQKLIKKLNKLNAYKIACDVPSGLSASGEILGACFRADTTITMGARKVCLYCDLAKDYVGKVRVADLGVSEVNFEKKSKYFLLEKDDLKLPFRDKKCVNKGDYGHAFVIAGKFNGAARIAAKSAFAMGTGLVSVIGKCKQLNSYLMKSKDISEKMNAGAVGMGLSEDDVLRLDARILHTKSLVLDAIMCSHEKTLEILKYNKNVVLTPHPKEFCALLKLCKIADISVNELQNNRLKYALLFTQNFKCILVLKGANTIIAKGKKAYFMCFGTPALAKGGSGDCLAGFILGLLAQGYKPLKAAKNGVLSHALAVAKDGRNFSLNANDIIKGIRCLAKK